MFRLLGYTAIFATCEKEVDKEIEMLRIKQMKEAYTKFCRKTGSSGTDMSWWGMGTFNVICSKDHGSRPHPICPDRAFDHLLSFEEACLAFEKLRKFVAGSVDWTTNFTLILLDAIITDAVNNFRAAILNTSNTTQKGSVLPGENISALERAGISENRNGSTKEGVVA